MLELRLVWERVQVRLLELPLRARVLVVQPVAQVRVLARRPERPLPVSVLEPQVDLVLVLVRLLAQPPANEELPVRPVARPNVVRLPLAVPPMRLRVVVRQAWVVMLLSVVRRPDRSMLLVGGLAAPARWPLKPGKRLGTDLLLTVVRLREPAVHNLLRRNSLSKASFAVQAREPAAEE